MKILLTGGGTGGHFYPLIAVAESINKIAREQKLFPVELYYMAPTPYESRLLFDNGITFVPESAGKMRRYFSLLNIVDFFRTIWGVLKAMRTMFKIYPDVVFAKGGYVSFPALFAARFFRIPVVIHESDSVPGRLNKWAGKFARRIAVSYPDAAQYFKKKEKVAFTGNPIRNEVKIPARENAFEYLKLDHDVPIVLIIGGSLGAQLINENVLDALPRLVEKYQVIHQTGRNNFKVVKETADAILLRSQHKYRYKPYEYLDSMSLRMAAGAASVIVSRAGSSIFEIANWGAPAILIPITDTNGDHQRKNAYSYARTGAAIVIEEVNLTPNILTSEIDRIVGNEAEKTKMQAAAKAFARTDAADTIAQELLSICLEHVR